MAKKLSTLSDLPIYESAQVNPKSLWVSVPANDRSSLEEAIGSVRSTACSAVKQIKSQTSQLNDYLNSTRQSADKNLTYLRSESTILPKVVFISLSTLSGLLLGYRKSAFRKGLNCTLLATASTALTFPKETKVVSSKVNEFVSKEAEVLYRTYIWPEEKKVAKKEKQAEEIVWNTANEHTKLIKLNKEDLNDTVPKAEMVGNKGMSNDDDSDMYTTRNK